MEMINENNYEAFYLDFLEGNLNEEDTALLLDFLDQYPELKLEIDELVALDDSSLRLDNAYKQSLKQVLFDEDKIVLSNIDAFLIANTEGLLTKNKEAELKQFISKNPSFNKDQKLYESTKLKANLSEVFVDKSSLKRAKRVVLWPYLSTAVAAGIVLLLTLNIFNSGDNPKVVIAQRKNPIHSPTPKEIKTYDVKQRPVSDVKEQLIDPVVIDAKSTLVASVIETDINNLAVKAQHISIKKFMYVTPMKPYTIKSSYILEDDLEIVESTAKYIPSRRIQEESNYTLLGFKDMKNPIEPITNQLANAIKKEVDFRTAKPTSNHSGGFYLKIGKLVISRNKVH